MTDLEIINHISVLKHEIKLLTKRYNENRGIGPLKMVIYTMKERITELESELELITGAPVVRDDSDCRNCEG